MGYPDPISGVWFYEPGDPDSPMHEVLNKQSTAMRDLYVDFDQTIIDAYGDAVAQVIADNATVKQAAAAAMQDAAVIAQLGTWKGDIPSGTNIDNMRGASYEGTWEISSGTMASLLGTWPALPGGYSRAPGQLVIAGRNTSLRNNSSQTMAVVTAAGQPVLLWRTTDGYNETGAAAWSTWQRLNTMWNRGRIAAGTNWDLLRDSTADGIYSFLSTDLAGFGGTLPPGISGNGTLEVVAGHQYQVRHTVIEEGTGRIWVRGILSPATPTWRPWVEQARQTQLAAISAAVDAIVASGGGPGSNAGAAHTVLRERFVRARGGRIGTDGRAAVAIRWDHNPDAPIAAGIPALHRDRGIPLGWATYSRQVGDVRHTTPLSTIEQYALNYGFEIWNHGATHLDATTTAGYVQELATSRAELRAAMPSQLVDCFAIPGVAGTNMGGFITSATPESLSGTEAGRIALEHHALISGNESTRYYPLTGQPSNLSTPLYIQSMTAAAIIAAIKEAQASGAGLQMMLHPNWIGVAGGITLADYTAVLDYMAAERNAGRLALPSLSGWHLCDASTSYRHDLALNSDFADGKTGWTGAGYTAATGMLTGSGVLEQTLDMAVRSWARGACRETVLEVRAAAGATVTLERNGATVGQLVIAAGDTGWKTLRRTTYLGMTRATDSTKITASAQVDVRAARLLAT